MLEEEKRQRGGGKTTIETGRSMGFGEAFVFARSCPVCSGESHCSAVVLSDIKYVFIFSFFFFMTHNVEHTIFVKFIEKKEFNAKLKY